MPPRRLLLCFVLATFSAAPSVRADSGLESQAISLLEARRYEDLDRLLRGLLITPARRPEAAALLRNLDAIPAYEPPIDKQRLEYARDQVGPGFDLTQSRHFVVLSNGRPDWTRERLWLLERTYDQFFRAAGRMDAQVYPPAHKLLCILIEDHGAYQAFARAHDGVDASWIAGYYASLSNRVVFYDDRTGPSFAGARREVARHRDLARQAEREALAQSRKNSDPHAQDLVASAREYRASVETQASRLLEEAESASTAKTIHEAIHLLAFNCGLQSRARQYPLWLTEGLASRFETIDPDRSFGPGSPQRSRDDELRLAIELDLVLPLEALVALNHVPASAEEDHEIARTVYSQADSFFEWCFRYERRSLLAYFEDLAREPAGMISPRRHDQMFRERFGDPTSIGRTWLREERRRLAVD